MTLITPAEISALLNMPKRATMELLRQPYFPAPTINLSERMRRWNRDTIVAWLQAQERKNSR